MPKFKSLLLISLFSFFVNIAFSQLVSVPFDNGFIGSIGTNTQQANSTTSFTTLGISKSSFIQQTINGIFYYTQGNDIGGKLRIYFTSAKNVTISGVTTSKSYIDIDGAIVWRGPGGGVGDYYGFLPSPNTNITFNYGVSSTYTISRSSNGSTGSNIGNLRVDKTLSLSNNESGNAAGVDDDLNAYLTTVRSLDPNGPITVSSLTTTNQTPTITGTATLIAGESLTVTVNGVVYSVGDGNLTNNGTTWTLVIPSTLAVATYSVEAIITNSSGFTLTDGTSDELVIYSPTLTVNGTLKTFTSCSGCSVSPQSFSVSGSNLATNNLVVTAPTGVVVSTNSASGFSSSVSLTPTSGTVTTTTIYAKLSDNSTSVSSGVISVTSIGATSKTFTVTTNTDNALNFDGSNDYISLSSNIPYTNNAITIDAWIKTTSPDLTSVDDIISWGNTTYGSTSTTKVNVVEFRVYRGKLSFVLNDNNLFFEITSNDYVNTGKWVHVAVVKSGTNITLYINGQVANATIVGNATSAPLPNITNIGALAYNGGSGYNVTAGSYFPGDIDQIRVWNTAKDITDISTNRFVVMSGNEPGLVASYDFNQGIANGSNGSLTILNNVNSNTYSGTLNNFALTGTSSNYIVGFIPSITATGSATSVAVGNTLQLSNGLSGGTWSSSNASFATVSSSGLVTGVASGSVTITYAICDKTVSYALTVTQPTITTSGILKTFTTCSGCTLNPQNFSVSGSNLGANITLTAPTGVVLSTTYSGTYSSSLTLTQTSGSVTTTSVYVKLSNNSTSISSGVISITSTGATSKTITVTTNTDNALIFNGTDNYALLDASVVNGLTNFTFETWVYPSSNSAFQRMFDFGINTSNYMLFTLNSGTPFFAIQGSSYPTLSATSSIPLNEWSHLAVVLNATAQTATIYINGLAAGSGSMPLNPSSLGTITTAYLGKGFYADPYFKGKMDEIRIWNTARSASEIANNYLNELIGNETGLQVYYNMNQGMANASNSGLTTLEDRTSAARTGTLYTFALSGTSSNYVDGFIPSITAAGSATTLAGVATLTLSNNLSGGTWSSTNSAIATVNSSGLVTGVAAGSVTITYSICGKTANYSLRVTVPTITTTGTLPVIASCSGCSVNPPSFTLSGSDLSNNITLTAPSGVVISTTSTGTYSTSLSLTQSSGSVTNTSIFVKLSNNATTNNSGVINITSTGAASKTMSVTVNADNALNFDGSDAINIGQPLSSGNSFTMEAWINYKGSLTENNIISSSSNVFWIYQDKLNGGVANSYQLVTSPNVLEKNKWYHVALTLDDPANLMKLYIDGNLVASTTTSLSFTGGQNSYIGSHFVGGPVSFFNGNIDEVRIWNLVRSDAEIAGSMNSELSGNESGLVSYYNFNQGVINGTNTSITTLTDVKGRINGSLSLFNRTGATSNFVTGFIPQITGTATSNVGASSTLSNSLTGGTWSSTNTAIATVNSSTGIVTGVAAGSTTITYTICDKTVSTSFAVTVPTITASGTLTPFTTCSSSNSAAQSFTVSAQYLTANLVLTAPTGYEIATSSGGTYSSTISISPSSGSVSARLIYVRSTTSIVNGQSGNIVITSTGATTKNVATGNAVVTQNKTASVTITSNATNNTICSGASITFTANATNGGLTPTYQWKLNGVDIGGATNATYTTTALSSTSTITVVMGSSIATCLSGSPATSNAIVVNVNDVPNNPSAFTGLSANLTTICMNSNQVYSVAAVTGATSYTWLVTGSLSASVTSTTNVINIIAANAAGSGTISVYANNACGTSVGSATLSVTVDNTPAPTANFTVLPANNVCLTSASITFTSTSTPNATSSATISSYNWDFGDGNTASSTTASNTYTSSGKFDAILTIQSSDNCTSQVSSRIIVDPISVAGTAAALNTTICEGSNTKLSLTGNTGTIQWQSSTDGTSFTDIIGATSAIYTTPNLTSTIYYKAIVSSGICTSASSGVVTVTVSPIPTVNIAAVADVLDNATSFNIIYTNAIGNPDTYSIVAAAPNSMTGFASIVKYGLLGSPINVAIPSSTTGTYNFLLTLENASIGCTSSAIPFTLNVLPQPPASLSYTSPHVYPVGTSITALTPSSTGGPIATYSIAPSLPAGLTLNTSTGIISGTPTVTSSQTSYTVTGTNASGTITATVVITVNEAAPASLLYNTPNVYKVGTIITALNPTSTGGPIATYSIAPSLPAGLTLNTSTGIISGTPTATSVQTSYTVTGTNTTGTITATVVITVNEAAPASLLYTTPNVYTVGTTITALNPTSTGGPIVTYSIAPSLPAGLTLNTSTGIISGTPTVTSVQTSYTVTGTNASGTITATVVITVNEAAPLSLSYTTPNVDTVGIIAQVLNPTSTGGPIVTYSIAPTLPAGLTLNTSTGVISGTPTVASGQTTYIVTGTNASGTVTATVVITVKEAVPASLSYNTPNVYTVGTIITALTPTSTGGPIATYSITPGLPAGLTFNTTTGVISGTPTEISGQLTYTVTGTNNSGSVSTTVVITIVSGQPLLPQGGIDAVDYKLLAVDTVKIKLNIPTGASPFNLVIGNNSNSLKDTITNVLDGDIIKLSPVSNTTIYSIVKLTDNNGAVRTSGFNKDTTMVTILAPNIALTLKADKAVKLIDNSFNTKLLLKIKNSGEINLKNVQVNANLSEVFPAGINYTLDSVKVSTGTVTLNNGYKGNGTAKSPNSVNKGISASSGIKVNAILDANYLFNNGVSMAINEESDISFYISIAPTTENVVLKLQFTSAGEGVLIKNDGSTSQQSSIAASDDGTNIGAHPNNTNTGTPAPTYLPLFPVASIGAALSASNPTIVTNGYTFDFVAKLKNFSNINLDTIAIINDFSKTFTSPDTAYIINTPVVTGGITYNTNFNGYSNTLLIDSATKLVVGDSATIAYTLFVKTTKTTGSWSNSILGSGHSTIDYIYVSDVSKDGVNPDPNGDNDPLEKGNTSFYVNYTPPAPPVVENKTYIFGTTTPTTIAPLVKSYPTGSVPVWCNVATTLCSTTAPATPTIIGKYVYQLKSYDTTTKLYSIAYVNDTVIIKPPVPLVKDSSYIIGLNTNPANIGVQVVGMQGSLLNYFLLANRLTVVPVLGTSVSVKRYTVSQTVNEIESDTVGFNVTMLNQNDMVHLQKLAEEPILQSNSTFNITYKFIVNNLSAHELTNVLITDNLQNTIPITAEYTIVSINATGGLVANTSFNGSTNTYLTNATSKVNAFAKDTLVFTLNMKPKGFSGVMNNSATIAATTPYGLVTMVSSAATKIAETTKSPTPVIIPDVIIDIPEVFSPNRDGVNDRFVIIKPFGTTLNLEIFNRWGNVVYANANYNNEWDGRGTNNFIGQDLLDGGYYYNLKAINKNGETKIFKGFVIIQR